MPFQLPTFNIVVGIRHATAAGVWGDPDFSVAQLSGISKVEAGPSPGGVTGTSMCYRLKLPAGTDVRDASNFAYTDLVEVDGFSQPLVVSLVYDVAFGFENEYRVALLSRQAPVGATGWARLPGQGDVMQP